MNKVDYSYIAEYPSVPGLVKSWVKIDGKYRLLGISCTSDIKARATKCSGSYNRRRTNPPVTVKAEPIQYTLECIVQADGSEIHFGYEVRSGLSQAELQAEKKRINDNEDVFKRELTDNFTNDELITWSDMFPDRKTLRDWVYAKLAERKRK